MRDPAGRHRAAVAWLILTAYVASFVVPPLAAAQGAGTSKLQKGREYYEQSRFDDAIKLLKDLVSPAGGLAGADLQSARELLARSYVKKGDAPSLQAANDMFKEILRATPEWRPDPVQVPPDEIAAFEQALLEYTREAAGTPSIVEGGSKEGTAPPTVPTKKSSKKAWYMVGGGVLLAGIVALAAGGGKKDEPPPPEPTLAGFPTPPSP